jgi:asparagine synthase (glutamine-hydrolysing)
MCGVFGIVSHESHLGFSDLKDRAQRAINTLRFRGPDNQNIYVSDDKRIVFAHSRLSIIGLSPEANQPLFTQSGDSLLTYNGEIYNYKEINRQYGIETSIDSDTLTLAELLEKKGMETLYSLNGMFAFAHFDFKDQSLLLAVDHFGKKPLYYISNPKFTAFASEVKALKAFGIDLGAPNKDFLYDYLIYGASSEDYTYYSNVSKMLPGHYAQVSPQTPKVIQRNYWSQLYNLEPSVDSYDDAKQKVRELISRSVKARLISDVPVASFLSGGIDSSIISLEANSNGSKTPTICMSVDSKAGGYDESKDAQSVSTEIGSNHTTLKATTTSYNLLGNILYFDEPFADSSCHPTDRLCETVAKHFKVALGGDGGDELFGGYRRMQYSLALFRYGLKLPKILSNISKSLRQHPRSKLGYFSRLMYSASRSNLETLASMNTFFVPEDLGNYFEKQAEKSFKAYNRFQEYKNISFGNKILLSNLKTYLYSDLLVKLDRMSMKNSLEVRTPLLDVELCEYTLSLPAKYKFGPTYGKRLLCDAYRDHFSDDFFSKPKKGFGFPIEDFEDQFQLRGSQLPPPQNIDQRYAIWVLQQFE